MAPPLQSGSPLNPQARRFRAGLFNTWQIGPAAPGGAPGDPVPTPLGGVIPSGAGAAPLGVASGPGRAFAPMVGGQGFSPMEFVIGGGAPQVGGTGMGGSVVPGVTDVGMGTGVVDDGGGVRVREDGVWGVTVPVGVPPLLSGKLFSPVWFTPRSQEGPIFKRTPYGTVVFVNRWSDNTVTSDGGRKTQTSHTVVVLPDKKGPFGVGPCEGKGGYCWIQLVKEVVYKRGVEDPSAASATSEQNYEAAHIHDGWIVDIGLYPDQATWNKLKRVPGGTSKKVNVQPDPTAQGKGGKLDDQPYSYFDPGVESASDEMRTKSFQLFLVCCDRYYPPLGYFAWTDTYTPEGAVLGDIGEFKNGSSPDFDALVKDYRAYLPVEPAKGGKR